MAFLWKYGIQAWGLQPGAVCARELQEGKRGGGGGGGRTGLLLPLPAQALGVAG